MAITGFIRAAHADTPEADQRFVYDGWTLDTPLRASPGHRGAMGPAGPDAASQGWNVILVLDGLADVNEDGQPDTVRKYTWGLDLSGQSGNHSSPAGIHGAGGTLDTSGRRQGQVGGLLSVEETTGEHQGTYWFMHDANGNVSQVIQAGTWTLAAHYEYDPYGHVIRSTGSYAAANPFRFSTKWFDGEFGTRGLYYYGYRYYSPRLGRWVSRDPIGERGGVSAYVYVGNRSVDSSDPHGLLQWREPSSSCDLCIISTGNPAACEEVCNPFGATISSFTNCTSSQVGAVQTAADSACACIYKAAKIVTTPTLWDRALKNCPNILPYSRFTSNDGNPALLAQKRFDFGVTLSLMKRCCEDGIGAKCGCIECTSGSVHNAHVHDFAGTAYGDLHFCPSFFGKNNQQQQKIVIHELTHRCGKVGPDVASFPSGVVDIEGVVPIMCSTYNQCTAP